MSSMPRHTKPDLIIARFATYLHRANRHVSFQETCPHYTKGRESADPHQPVSSVYEEDLGQITPLLQHLVFMFQFYRSKKTAWCYFREREREREEDLKSVLSDLRTLMEPHRRVSAFSGLR